MTCIEHASDHHKHRVQIHKPRQRSTWIESRTRLRSKSIEWAGKDVRPQMVCGRAVSEQAEEAEEAEEEKTTSPLNETRLKRDEGKERPVTKCGAID